MWKRCHKNYQVFILLGLEQIAEQLIQSGADVNAVDSKGNSALMWSIEKGKKEIMAEASKPLGFFSCNTIICFIHLFIGFEKIVKILIEKDANVNAVNENNISAVLIAINKGKIIIL